MAIMEIETTIDVIVRDLRQIEAAFDHLDNEAKEAVLTALRNGWGNGIGLAFYITEGNSLTDADREALMNGDC